MNEKTSESESNDDSPNADTTWDDLLKRLQKESQNEPTAAEDIQVGYGIMTDYFRNRLEERDDTQKYLVKNLSAHLTHAKLLEKDLANRELEIMDLRTQIFELNAKSTVLGEGLKDARSKRQMERVKKEEAEKELSSCQARFRNLSTGSAHLISLLQGFIKIAQDSKGTKNRWQIGLNKIDDSIKCYEKTTGKWLKDIFEEL